MNVLICDDNAKEREWCHKELLKNQGYFEEGLKVLAKLPIDPEVARQVDAGLVEYVEAPWFDEAADYILK